MLAIAVMAIVDHRFFTEQFLGGEFAAQADIVMHPDGLLNALGPVRHDMLDQRPGADRLDVNPLVLVERGFGHGKLARCRAKASGALLIPVKRR